MNAEHLPDLVRPRPFRPAAGFSAPHVQTLVGRALRSRDAVPLSRERWTTPDGDFLDLDFTRDPNPASPLVLVIHGLEGSATRNYCLETYRALAHRGVSAVGLNLRSCSGEPNLKARAYHSGETEDLRWVVGQLARRYPSRPLGAIGFSLGGNMLLKFLGEARRDDATQAAGSLSAAVAISVPFDLAAGSAHLERSWAGRNIYLPYFLRSLKRKVDAKAHLFPDDIDLDTVRRATTLRDFDQALTAPLHGFASALDYYERSSSARWLDSISTPTLVLQSLDDPFLPRSALPSEALDRNPWIHAELTPRGGHVGFLEGSPWHPGFWAEASAAHFLAHMLSAA
jgi:predicted alpha/beta-fold hydrolase